MHLDAYQLAALSHGGVVPLVLLAAVVVAHHQTHPTRHGWRYWITVLHPLLIPAAFLFAVLTSPAVDGPIGERPYVVWLGFYGLLILSIAGIVASSFPWRDRWWLPAVHFVTLLVVLWCTFIGSMAIAHDWL